MNKHSMKSFLVCYLWLAATSVAAAPALEVLGQDYVFPNRLEGVPKRLSDFNALQINRFETSDGVSLSYWEAGEGEPLIFIPGWSANGAEFINIMYLLSKRYHVIVLDPRNQGLSERVPYGSRISRHAMDVRELSQHLQLKSAYYCGWSMGASILWSYIDLFGTDTIRKMAIIDEPISIYSHADWTEAERLNAGGMTTSPERMVSAFTEGVPTNTLIVDTKAMERFMARDSAYFVNSESFAATVIHNDPQAMSHVLFDHATNDWRDVVQFKMNIPTAIFTGELSNNLPSQRWMHSVVPGSQLYVYTKAEQGDHFLAFKNPKKFTTDLMGFLEAK